MVESRCDETLLVRRPRGFTLVENGKRLEGGEDNTYSGFKGKHDVEQRQLIEVDWPRLCGIYLAVVLASSVSNV